MANQLVALCAIASFLWLANNLEDHQVIEQPRLSSLLVLLIAAISSYVVSFFAVWLPGANGRFDEELAPLKVARNNLPKKPRRYFLPGLVVCIVLRLEIFHRITFDLQCSRPGLEALLPLFIVLYELLPNRRTRPKTGRDDEEVDLDDPGMTVFEAMGVWFNESNPALAIGTLMLTMGTYIVSTLEPTSTFFCSRQDRRGLVVLFQWAGVLLDAVIAIVTWRVLAWARTTKSRLRTLSGILAAAALATGLVFWSSRLVRHSMPVSYNFRGLDSLYLFDVVVDGLAFASFLIATSLLATEGSPLSLVGTLTFLFGILLAVRESRLIGTWENILPSETFLGLTFICAGFIMFVYANNVQSVVFVHRAFLVFLLVILFITASIYTPIKASHTIDRHPLAQIIYDARIEADRWLRHATVSSSLPVAVDEYKERHGGRAPPPKFDIWYQFAKDKRSPILDHFPQIENDLLPFWGMPPSKIREDVRRAAEEPDMALLQIHGGEPQHNIPPSSPYKPVMDDLIDLIKEFAQHLPDMELAINLDERPRVLAPWDDVQRLTKAASRTRISKLLPRTVPAPGDLPEARSATNVRTLTIPLTGFTSAKALREMTALTCPPGSKARAATHWDIRDFCAACAAPHSQGMLLTNWLLSQDICHQPDLLRLHGFHTTPTMLRPVQELLPVFSRSKTNSYSDILLPLRRISEPAEPTTEGFDMKTKQLFWRGKVDRFSSSHELLRGGHQERLVHSLNSLSSSEQTRLLLPDRDNKQWSYAQVSTAELNTFLPLDVAFTAYSACKPPPPSSPAEVGVPRAKSGACASAGDLFRIKPEDLEPLRSQYVLVLDTDSGPPRELPRTLRSASVPFLGSVFREWYSDRLQPWAHFVPVDLRLHALHGVLAYFVGIQDVDHDEGRRSLGGVGEVKMRGRPEDGKWIAEQGQRWAEKALRREDQEVYLFRLLLEWGRVVDEHRDEVGYVIP